MIIFGPRFLASVYAAASSRQKCLARYPIYFASWFKNKVRCYDIRRMHPSVPFVEVLGSFVQCVYGFGLLAAQQASTHSLTISNCSLFNVVYAPTTAPCSEERESNQDFLLSWFLSRSSQHSAIVRALCSGTPGSTLQ